MPINLPGWLTRPYTLVTGCALCTGLAVGLIEDARRLVTDTVLAVFFPAPDARTACIEGYFDDLGPPAPGAYRILLTELVNDPDQTQTRLVDRTLRRLYGEDVGAAIQLDAIPSAIYATLGNAGQRTADAQARARSLAERAGADVVLWGEVITRDAQIALSMTHATDTAKADYTVAQSTLTTDFGETIGSLIKARMLTLIDLGPGDEGTFLADRMRRVISLTQPLTDDPPAQMTDADRASLFVSHGYASYLVGLQAGDPALLETAVASFQTAIDAMVAGSEPWAHIQIQLGNALQVLGERLSDTARLAQSVEAYRRALTLWTRATNPDGWAGTQNNIGNALSLIAEQKPEQREALLRQAVEAYEKALLEWTKEAQPYSWALAQNNLGIALRIIGQDTGDAALLERSVAAYENALTVRTRDAVPVDWAMTQNNLGVALLTLGEREQGTARLLKARAAFTSALTVQTRDQVPVDWGFTQGNLSGLELAMFEKTADPAHLTAARDHATAAADAFALAGADRFVAMAEAQIAQIAARERP